MSLYDKNRISSLLYIIGTILLFVIFWDIYGLKVDSWPYFYPFKIFTVSLYLCLGFLVRKGKVSPQLSSDIAFSYIYIYAYIATVYLHSTYMFAFYEAFAFWCFAYNGNILKYLFITLLGLVLALLSIQGMPEPDFIAKGFSIKGHLHVVTVIFAALSFFIFWLYSRQKEIIYLKDQKFASIGRQSAFLLHELKSPLSRFMMSNSEKDNRDAEYILSIIEGVELLIAKKENLIFNTFEWSEIEAYIHQEFKPTCDYYKIDLEVSGFSDKGFGHRSTIKLALKNLIKNATEAIIREESSNGLIKIRRDQNVIEVSNNGSIISKEKIEELFKPFYSDKNTRSNYGIGLHFVDSVVRAHSGKIDVNVENGFNIFKITLGAEV